MPYMYILECADGSYYTGSTWDLERRLWEHQNGLGAKHTAKRLPVTLLYCEECERIEDAYIREKQIQGWSHKKKQALIAGDMNQIHRLAECRNESHWRNVGFDSAQPTADSREPAITQSIAPNRSLSDDRSLSEGLSLSDDRSLSEERSLSEVEGNNASHLNPLSPFDSAQGTESTESSDKPKRIVE